MWLSAYNHDVDGHFLAQVNFENFNDWLILWYMSVSWQIFMTNDMQNWQIVATLILQCENLLWYIELW